jgi:hypothetical protein
MKTRTATFTLLLMFLMQPTASRAVELSEAEFKRLHDELRPAANELWRTIPWKISLLDAQHAAAKAQKPIFIWAMDGHPLGCT